MPNVDRLRVRAKRLITRSPYLYDAFSYVRPYQRERLARRDSVLVIEGYPRSANTYAVVAFEHGNDGHVGHHLHAASHLLRAARLGVPAIALVRNPLDAAASYLVRRPALEPADALREYLDFYEPAWRARSAFAVGLFEEVITDFGAVVRRVNAMFATGFVAYTPSREHELEVLRQVELRNVRESGGRVDEQAVARPSRQRWRQASSVREAFDRESVQRLRARAEEVHARYRTLAAQQAEQTAVPLALP